MLPGPNEMVFVYGTLKRGGQYHSFMQAAGGEFMGTGTLAIPYPLILAQYPCLLDQPGQGHRVRGEVFRIPESTGWQPLDQLEGYPQEYDRRVEEVLLGDQSFRAWTYFYRLLDQLDPGLPPVESFPVSS